MRCPMCKKSLQAVQKTCPSCQADLSLLADYLDRLRDRLTRAESLTREGELGEAVWTYLEVLEVDPDHPAARRQVGRVAAAVRNFDRRASPSTWQRVWVWPAAMAVALAGGFILGLFW